MPKSYTKEELQIELNKILMDRAKKKINHKLALNKLDKLRNIVKKQTKHKTHLQLINRYKKIFNSFTT